MSIHNALKYGVQFSRAAARALGLGEDEEGLSRLGESIQVVADLWSQPEWAFLRAERGFAGSSAEALDAVNRSWLAIINPVNSGYLVVVEDVNVTTNVDGQECFLGSLDATDATGAAGATQRNLHTTDSRWDWALPRPRAQQWGGSHQAGTFLNEQIERIFMAGAGREAARAITTPYVLSPGFGIAVETNVINATIRANWKGRERQLFPGEGRTS